MDVSGHAFLRDRAALTGRRVGPEPLPLSRSHSDFSEMSVLLWLRSLCLIPLAGMRRPGQGRAPVRPWGERFAPPGRGSDRRWPWEAFGRRTVSHGILPAWRAVPPCRSSARLRTLGYRLNPNLWFGGEHRCLHVPRPYPPRYSSCTVAGPRPCRRPVGVPRHSVPGATPAPHAVHVPGGDVTPFPSDCRPRTYSRW